MLIVLAGLYLLTNSRINDVLKEANSFESDASKRNLGSFDATSYT